MSIRVFLALVSLAIAPVGAIWPVPRHIETGNHTAFVDQTLQITYNGDTISYTSGYEPPAGSAFDSKTTVQAAVSRSLDAIFQSGIVPWMLRARGSDFEPALQSREQRIGSLQITQTGTDKPETFKPIAGQVDESYSLNVTEDGRASISAESHVGVLRALETFTQLFFKHSSGTSWYTEQVPVYIRDSPRFPHRGVHLDVARHWFNLEDIRRTIDGLSMSKLNVLHLHITDTQSWPLEIPALPRLAEKGAYHKSLTYTPDDIATLHQYAVHRGVQIITEIDMPGHFGIEEAYPGLSVAYNKQPYQWYCAQPPCGSLKLNSTDVEDFLDTLFEDLLPRLSPYTSYFHTGGDEYKANNSLLDPALKTNEESILQPMLQRFLDHAHNKIRSFGLAPFVWEEMVLQWNATVGKDVVIQSWLGQGAIKTLTEAGHKVIDTSNDFYYLDCGRGEFIDYDNGAAYQQAYPFYDWCQPTKNWKLIYSHDPAEGLSDAAAKNVLGGELAVWTETIDATSLDSIIWPRACAAGEVWWSGSKDEHGTNRSMYEVRPRLSEMRERMLARGVRGTPLTQLWCDQANPGDCGGQAV